MELRNLDKNILYWICEEMTRSHHCGPIDTNAIYRSYADLPAEKITDSIHTLVEEGLLREEGQQARLFLTKRGRSEIRAFIPERIWPECDPAPDCPAH